MIARAIAARKRKPLQKWVEWVRLDVGGDLPRNQRARLALTVRAYRTDRPVACGCRGCDATIHPGELFTMGNQRDHRGRYARCYVCMPFEVVNAAEGGPR